MVVFFIGATLFALAWTAPSHSELIGHAEFLPLSQVIVPRTMAVAHAPVGVAACGQRPGQRMAPLSDNGLFSLTSGNSRPMPKGRIFSASYSSDLKMLYNVNRTKCSGLSRPGPFGAAVSKLGLFSKRSVWSALGTSMGRSDSASFLMSTSQGRYRRRSVRGVECFSTSVADVGSAALAMEWRPAVDQVMLVISVALAYVAGIATPTTSTSSRKPIDVPLSQTSSLPEVSELQSERELETEDVVSEAQEGDPWVITELKLGGALSRLSNKEKDARYYEVKDKAVRNPVLSLQALGVGPRLRLLVLALEHLHTQVNLIAETDKVLSSAEWSKLTLDLLCGSVEPICRRWLAQEPSLSNSEQQGSTQVGEQRLEEPPGTLGSASPEQSANIISEARNLVLDYLQRSGKTELYMDLLFFLRYQTMRPGGCCEYSVMSRHASNALEDLVVALADGAAALYIGRDAQIGGLESDWPILVRASIKSTRALERFRNEIALQSWFQRNYTSVVSVFEDRFTLWTIESAPNPRTDVGAQQQMKVDDSGEDLRLKLVEVPARRGKELRALTGWRYYYSLYLEFSDIVGPLLNILVKKMGEAVSFLLVRLIGRSLGLIFEGIRQSVRWSSR